MAEPNDEIVIIGSGLAGYGVVRELRKLDADVSITLVTQDDGAFYSKPRLSNHLSSGRATESLVNMTGAMMSEKNDFKLLAHHQVESINPEKHLLRTNQGDISFGKLVLAMGASPRQPSYSNDSDRVHAVNHLKDYLKFQEHLSESSRILIYGGGLVACEFANDLAVSGHQVHLIARGTSLLDPLVGSVTSDQLVKALQRVGVHVCLNNDIVSVQEQTGGFVEVELKRGGHAVADVVLNAIGLVPHPLLKSIGLESGKGLLVNDNLQTSHPDIYALGDIAQYSGGWLPFVMPITHAAKFCAASLLGKDGVLSFPPMPIAVKTTSYPMVIGSTTLSDLVHTYEVSEIGSVEEWSDDDGGLRGFVLGGDRCAEKAAFIKRWVP
jgi:rubredoxin-NAD+ reductase